MTRSAGAQGSNVLIVGHGSIGRAIEKRLAPFGVDIVGVARRPRPGELCLIMAYLAEVSCRDVR